MLEAYADGVNAWLAANPLPSEYAALELTKANVPPWTMLDSLALSKLLSFGLSFETNDITNTQRLGAYQAAGAALGFDGRKLFFEDVNRIEPFAHAPSIFPGETSQSAEKHGGPALSPSSLAPEIGAAAREALENLEGANLPTALADQGSNIWVVSGKKSANGRPMVASDPHLSARVTGDLLRGRRRRERSAERAADALRRHLSGLPRRGAWDERPCLVGLDRQPDRCHRHLPGAAHDRGRRSGRDDLQGQPRADADHP